MRRLILSAATLALIGGADTALAQRIAVPGPIDAQAMPAPPLVPPARESRWGAGPDGRWWGGGSAPGGWSAYRRPERGRRLPSYWVSPQWYVADWADYGLPAPPYGYSWSRYYDDAVLLDRRGQVYDAMRGVHWDGPDQGAPLPPPTVVHRPDGVTVVTTSTSGGTPGYYAGGYYYPGPTVTTISIQSAPRAARATGGYGDAVTYTTRPAPVVRHKRKRRTRR